MIEVVVTAIATCGECGSRGDVSITWEPGFEESTRRYHGSKGPWSHPDDCKFVAAPNGTLLICRVCAAAKGEHRVHECQLCDARSEADVLRAHYQGGVLAVLGAISHDVAKQNALLERVAKCLESIDLHVRGGAR